MNQQLSSEILLDDDGNPYDNADIAVMSPEFYEHLLQMQRKQLSQPLRKRNRSGEYKADHVVYAATDNEFVLVGRTSVGVEKSLVRMQQGNARQLYYMQESPKMTYREAVHLQKAIRGRFGSSQKVGDWFEMDEAGLKVLIEMVERGVERKE